MVSLGEHCQHCHCSSLPVVKVGPIEVVGVLLALQHLPVDVVELDAGEVGVGHAAELLKLGELIIFTKIDIRNIALRYRVCIHRRFAKPLIYFLELFSPKYYCYLPRMFDHSSSNEKMRHKYDNSDDCDDSEDDFILVWLRKLPEKCFDLPELHCEDNRYY